MQQLPQNGRHLASTDRRAEMYRTCTIVVSKQSLSSLLFSTLRSLACVCLLFQPVDACRRPKGWSRLGDCLARLKMVLEARNAYDMALKLKQKLPANQQAQMQRKWKDLERVCSNMFSQVRMPDLRGGLKTQGVVEL